MTIGKADGNFSGGKLEYGETFDQYIEKEFRRKKSWCYGLQLSKIYLIKHSILCYIG